jgi:phage terminase large subunit-like protein
MSKMAALEPFTLEHFKIWAESLILDNGEPWVIEPFQESFIEDVFAGKPVCWLVIPEGNGKTTLVAGLALYYIQFKTNTRVFVAAASRDQATDNCFGQMNSFVLQSGAEYEKMFTPQEGHRRVLCKETHSRIQIRAADERTGDGLIANLVIVDELHRHKDLSLYRTWRGKLRKRNGQMLVISTAGEPGGEFEQQRERMRTMAEEVERDEVFTRAVGGAYALHDWAVPEDGDSDDLDLVARANPLSSVTEATLREERDSPDWNLQHWRRMKCNLPTRGELAAITEKEWFDAEVDDEIPVGEPIYLGLDVAWKYDTTAAVPLWVRDEEFRLLGPARVLVPPRDGNSLDPHLVEHALTEIHLRNPIHTLVMDPTKAEQLAEWCREEFDCEVVIRGQSNAFHCEDYEKFMEALRMGWLKHTGDKELTRHAMNAIARPATYGDLRFDRPVSSRTQSAKAKAEDLRVIDALVAAAMVHTSASADLGGGSVVWAAA